MKRIISLIVVSIILNSCSTIPVKTSTYECNIGEGGSVLLKLTVVGMRSNKEAVSEAEIVRLRLVKAKILKESSIVICTEVPE